MQYGVFLVLAPLASLVLAVALIMVARRPHTEQSFPILGALCVSLGFLISNSLELVWPKEAGTMFFAQLGYLFSTPIPVFMFLFTLAFNEREDVLPGKLRILLFAIPLATTVLAFTEPSHHLIWSGISFRPVGKMLAMNVSYGWFYWVCFAYSVSLMIVSAVFVFREYSHAQPVFRRQLLLVIIGVCIPLVLYVIYTLKVIPGLTKNFSPIAYAVAAVFLAASLRRHRFLDLMPIARSFLLEEMSDGMIIVDPARRIVDINHAAQEMLGLTVSPVGDEVEKLTELAEVLAIDPAIGGHREIRIGTAEKHRYYDARVSRIANRADTMIGSMILLRDVSETHAVIEEKNRLIVDLTRAADEIRSLQEMIPICMFCKKVRDDEGFWHQVENYVSNHSSMQFSHGLCPDCERKHKDKFKIPSSSE